MRPSVPRVPGFMVCWLSCAIAGCDRELDRPILFILPTGFRGLIALKEDEAHGIEIPRTEALYEVVVPPDGHLLVQDFDIFEQWHVAFAEYEDGRPLPMADRMNDGDSVAFHYLPLVSRHHENRK